MWLQINEIEAKKKKKKHRNLELKEELRLNEDKNQAPMIIKNQCVFFEFFPALTAKFPFFCSIVKCKIDSFDMFSGLK